MITDKKMSPGTEPELAGSKQSRAPSKHDNKKSTHTIAGVVLQESVMCINFVLYKKGIIHFYDIKTNGSIISYIGILIKNRET